MKVLEIKNILDEQQEQTLLRIEHNGFWITFWGLIALILVKLFLGADISSLAGELIVFAIVDVYMGVSCIQNGIWDRHVSMKTSNIVIISAAAGIIIGGLIFIQTLFHHADILKKAFLMGTITALATFGLLFLAESYAQESTVLTRNLMNNYCQSTPVIPVGLTICSGL